MQKFFTIFASPEVKNRSNTSITYSANRKWTKNRKNLCGAICWSFTSFISWLWPQDSSTASCPTCRRVWRQVGRLRPKTFGCRKNTVSRNTPTFWRPGCKTPRATKLFFPIETGHASISTEAEYTGVNIYVKTDENSDPTVVRTLNRINYILLLSIPALLAKLSILILVALIINILRKSVRDEQPLPGRIIIYTRAVGFLLILAEVCTGVGSYIYQSTTRTFLEDSPLQVAASFPLNYWNIVMAILVLFSAEVFSIGSRLSEEQKLTI